MLMFDKAEAETHEDEDIQSKYYGNVISYVKLTFFVDGL